MDLQLITWRMGGLSLFQISLGVLQNIVSNTQTPAAIWPGSRPIQVSKKEVHENGFVYHNKIIDNVNTANAGNLNLTYKHKHNLRKSNSLQVESLQSADLLKVHTNLLKSSMHQTWHQQYLSWVESLATYPGCKHKCPALELNFFLCYDQQLCALASNLVWPITLLCLHACLLKHKLFVKIMQGY